MSDIMKFIVGEEPEEWNESIAQSRAREQGIELTEAHWDVVRALRKYYKEHGQPPNARKLADMLDAQFSAQGGRKYLYRLFPKGPVTQGCRIAGLPIPQHSVDPSFGTSQ